MSNLDTYQKLSVSTKRGLLILNMSTSQKSSYHRNQTIGTSQRWHVTMARRRWPLAIPGPISCQHTLPPATTDNVDLPTIFLLPIFALCPHVTDRNMHYWAATNNSSSVEPQTNGRPQSPRSGWLLVADCRDRKKSWCVLIFSYNGAAVFVSQNISALHHFWSRNLEFQDPTFGNSQWPL